MQCVSNCAGYPTTVIPGNTVVPYTGNQTDSGMIKFTVRPGEGQEIKLTAITYNTNYNFGDTTGAGTTIPGIGVYGENINNQTVTAQYRFKSPETTLVRFKDRRLLESDECSARPSKFLMSKMASIFSGPPGTSTNYLLNTAGTKVNNTSRFDTGPFLRR